MRICVIGTGYVGLVTGACLANVGHTVSCVDTDEKKVNTLRAGEVPFYEPGLAEIISHSLKENNISFYTSVESPIKTAEICFIAVGTPSDENGRADMSYVRHAALDIGKYMCSDLIVINKSTVPVGSQKIVTEWISEALRQRSVSYKLTVVSNPEFLKEGCAVDDFNRPDRIVIGTNDTEATEKIREMYAPFNQKRDRIIVMDPASAELTKYASNAMLATRISFMNEIALLCEHVGANVNYVRQGMGADERIGSSFLYAGCGYGGSCFPKDVSALISINEDFGLSAQILSAVKNVNDTQKHVVVSKVKKHFGSLGGLKFAVWGLSFKPNTDDIREAPALTFIDEVTSQGASVCVFCPKGTENAVDYFQKNKSVTFAKHKYDALIGADALVLMTEWPEFRNPDFDEIGTLLKQKVVFDGRNIYNRKSLEKLGFTVYQIG